LLNDQCLSDRKFNIECSYIDNDLVFCLKSQNNFNLIVISAALVLNWLQEMKKYLNLSNKSFKWEVCYVYKN